MAVTATTYYSKVEKVVYRIGEFDLNDAVKLLLKKKFPETKFSSNNNWTFEYCDDEHGNTYCDATLKKSTKLDK